MLCPNLTMVHSKRTYDPLLKGLERLKHLSSVKSAAANEVTTQHRKTYQIFWSLRQNKSNKSEKLYVPSTNYSYFANFSFFIIVKLKLHRKSINILLLHVTLTSTKVLIFYCVQTAKTAKSKHAFKGSNVTHFSDSNFLVIGR